MSHSKTEPPIQLMSEAEPTASVDHELLLDISQKINKQQEYLIYLSQGDAEIMAALSKQESHSEEIKSIKQHIAAIEKAIIKVYQHIEKDDTGKEIKAEQQRLRKAIETNQKQPVESNVYLDWRQLSIIITATALAASLCSYTVFQAVASWKADQPQNPPEKVLKTKSKKSSK